MTSFHLRVILAMALLTGPSWGLQESPRPATERPNIILFMADDLGWGEVGYQGQTKIRTPNIDRLAVEGMQFSQAYSGHTVCAPSRCVLLTGLHTGHAQIRQNSSWSSRLHVLGEGQEPLRHGTVTIGRVLQSAGYATGAFGKWGLGAPGDEGRPLAQGFDRFVGFMCQKRAHDHYPPALWKDGTPLVLDNPGYTPSKRWQKVPAGRNPWAEFSGEDYAADVMLAEALEFLDKHKQEPFFLYFPTPVPHAALQVPQDSLEEYLDKGWDDEPYLGSKGYLPHQAPRAAYAAMVTRMDAGLGQLLAKVDDLGLRKNTLVIFTSDNGATFNGGTDSAFFQSNGHLRGFKTSLWEGGIRVPFVARWDGQVPAGVVNTTPIGFQDVLPTMAELAGLSAPEGLDGVSLVEVLRNEKAELPERDLYFESAKHQALRSGDFKLVSNTKPDGSISVQLFNLEKDPREERDLSRRDGDRLVEMLERLTNQHTYSPRFPLAGEAADWDSSEQGFFGVSSHPLAQGANLTVPSMDRETGETGQTQLLIIVTDAGRDAGDYVGLAQHLASHGLAVLTVLGDAVSVRGVPDLVGSLESMNNKEGGFTFDRWGILGHGAGAITSVALAAELDQVTAVCLLQPTGALDDKELCLKMKASEAANLVVIAREDELCQISDCHLFAQLGSGQARRLYCNIPGLGHGDACGARDGESMTKRAKKAHAFQLSIVTEFFLAELTNDTRADEYLVARRGNWKVGHPAALKP